MPSASAVAIASRRLGALGYVHRGDLGVPGREAFRAPASGPRHHLYLCLASSHALANHLAVRDHLRAHPHRAAECGALKKTLADRFAHDSDGYTAGKTDRLLIRVLRDAGFDPGQIEEVERINRGAG